MHCGSCGRENRPDAQFCRGCGLALQLTCDQCGRILIPDDAFCDGCGARVDPGAATSATPGSPPATASTVSDQPISFANGRYQVKEFLGEGGQKKVYLAHDTLLDREVALSLIKTETLFRDQGLGHIFISHVEEDSLIATQLASALESRGYSTWYYERDSLPGPAYLIQTGDAIEQAQAVVLIISPQAVGSNQVTAEVVRAHEANKAFIPLLKEISHLEFQARAPVWRQALGASTSIGVSEGQVGEVAGRVIEGLMALGIRPDERRDEADRSRIIREVQAMGRVGSHPHIIAGLDLGEHEGQPYMVTELMAGGNIEDVIEESPDHRLPLQQAIEIAKETSRALEFAHSRGIVHHDLKPSNVLMTSEGTAKIGDFGMPMAVDPSRPDQEGMNVGTVSYMPPEQALGGEVTPRMNLYSLGAMLYEMVTGRPPFLGDDSVAIIDQHINTPPVAPTWYNSHCPRPLEALILRLLAKDPAERPESAGDVFAALEAIDLAATDQGGAGLEEPHALDGLAGGVFVGRQQEMGELKAALEDALAGRGRLVTLVGEPGIGKTRTAQELATYAGLRGAKVLWGRCYEEQGMPPYWPWVQAIRSYVRERDPEQLRSEMGAGAADIAEVVPDLNERLPDLQPPPELASPEQARFRLFDSITAFLKTASQRQPLVVVLEDLHWADQPSLLLLQFLVRELDRARVLVVGTYRDGYLSRQHPLAEILGELTRESTGGGFHRVLLRGLSQEDVGRFIEVATGTSPPQGLVSAVYTQTEGNPLFVTEVVRLLVQEGDIGARDGGPFPESDTWTVRIPEGIREVIGRRLNRLSQRCNEALSIAAVIGREFELRQLAPLVEDASEDRLLDVLEEASAARVIEELRQTVGRYQFTHALIQETLTGELSTTRRVRLHARIGEALEELYGANAESHAAELAHHFGEALGFVGDGKFVFYSLLAGDQALAAYAHEEGLAHFQRALETQEGQPVNPETAALLFGLGRAQEAVGQVHDAWATLGRAFDYYMEVGDVGKAVAVAEYPLFFVPGLSRVTHLVERALTLVPPDSHEAGRLLCRHGLLLNLETGDYERAQEAFSRALEIAQREGDATLEMRTLAAAADAAWYQMRWQEVLKKSLRAIELARRANDPYAEAWPRFLAAYELCATGDLAGAGEQALEMLAQAEKLRNRGLLALACLANVNVCRLKGDWSSARDFSDRGLSFDPRHSWLLAVRAGLEYEVGEFVQGESYMERLLDVMRATAPGPTVEYNAPAWLIPAVARCTGEVNWFDIAEEAGQTVLSSPSCTPRLASLRIGLALIPVQQNDVPEAERRYADLAPLRESVATGDPLAIGMATLDRVLGLLAATMSQYDQAASHFEEALDFCRKAGYLPELAWTCCDHADCLLQRGYPGDREKAVALLDESLSISRDLGMRPLMERVLSRRDMLKE